MKQTATDEARALAHELHAAGLDELRDGNRLLESFDLFVADPGHFGTPREYPSRPAVVFFLIFMTLRDYDISSYDVKE